MGDHDRKRRRLGHSIAQVSAERSVSTWSSVPGLIWTRFEDSEEYVVFHPDSGDVHLLTASAYRLWQLVAERKAASLADLESRLGAELGRQPDTELTTATREALAFMDRAGLVRPV